MPISDSLDSAEFVPRILTFGEPLVVMVPDAPGALSPSHQFRPYPAGAELNTAVGLARLGLKASIACCVGADPFGSFLRTAARGEGVDDRCMEASEAAPTGVFFKQWTGLNRKTSVYYYRGTSPMAAGLWQAQKVRTGLQDGAWDWVHSTGITWMVGEQSALMATELFRVAHSLGISVSFDVNVRLKLASITQWQALVTRVLPYVTWFFLGDEEAKLLFDTDDALQLEQQVRRKGFVGTGVVVKRGDKGAAASVAGDLITTPVWPVSQVIDTVGAGDGFNAGFIAGVLRGGNVQEAMRLGSLVGAYAVTSVGDYQGYPTWTETLQEMSGDGSVER